VKLHILRLSTACLCWVGLACQLPNLLTTFTDLDIETSFAFTNFSTQHYAVLEIRDHDSTDASYYETPLLAPGATHRVRFLDSVNVSCPQALDLRVRLYERVQSDMPIGLDETEAVEATPIAAGQIEDIPACSVQVLETFTLVNWDAPEGIARVKLAQFTLIDEFLRQTDRFPNVDSVWESEGVDAELADLPVPDLAANEPITGRVILANGSPVADVGVLIRTRFRQRLNDFDDSNDPDAGFGDPIAVTFTDANGEYRFDRPAGAYQVELFSDDFLFRPVVVTLETPSNVIDVIAEPVS